MINNHNDLIVIEYPNKEAFILANRKDDRNRITNIKSVFKMLYEYENPLIKKYNNLSSEEKQDLDIIIDSYIMQSHNL